MELSLLRSDSENLNYNRNNIYQEISQRERMLKEKQDELAKMKAKEQAQQRELDEQEKLVQEKEASNAELRKQLEQLKSRQESRGNSQESPKAS